MYFVGLLILPFKVHADAIIDLQHRGGKMATMSEMSLKTQTQKQFIKKNCIINEPKIVMALLLIYITHFVLFCLEHYAWLGSSGFQFLCGTEISWLLNIIPELRVYLHMAQLYIHKFTLSLIAFLPQFV